MRARLPWNPLLRKDVLGTIDDSRNLAMTSGSALGGVRANADCAEPAQPAQQAGVAGRGRRELRDAEQPSDRVKGTVALLGRRREQ